MDGKDFYRYAKPCNDAGIKIFPLPSNNGKYKIAIESNGKLTIGKEIFENDTTSIETTELTRRGPVKTKTIVPSVWDKILELYKNLLDKNNLKPAA